MVEELSMTVRLVALLIGVASLPTPAAAQIFWQSPDFRGAPIAPGELGVGVQLPGATPVEERANIAWQFRSGLNVMALQCQFDPTLLAQNSYNGVLMNHKEELTRVYATLTAYFQRTNKTPKAGRDALDKYATKTYTGFSTVRAQFGYCQSAANIARSTLFAPRGSFSAVAVERLRELRNGLVLAGEQQFRNIRTQMTYRLPDLNDKCWDRKRGYRASCPAFG